MLLPNPGMCVPYALVRFWRGAIFGANPEKWDVALTEVERE